MPFQGRSEVRHFENAIHNTRVSSSSYCRETPRKKPSTVIVTTWSKRNNNTSRKMGCRQAALRRKLRDETSDFLCGQFFPTSSGLVVDRGGVGDFLVEFSRHDTVDVLVLSGGNSARFPMRLEGVSHNATDVLLHFERERRTNRRRLGRSREHDWLGAARPRLS